MFLYSCQTDQGVIPNSQESSPNNVLTEDSNSDVEISNPLISSISVEPISVVDGRMVFKTKEDYQQTLESLDDNNLVDFETDYNFLSMRKYYEDNPTVIADSILLDDELFPTLLNPDRILQIGQYIFKIDDVNQRLYVLHENDVNESYEELLQANPNNTPTSNIGTFGTDVNALELLEQGVITEPSTGYQSEIFGWFCRDRRAQRKKSEFTQNYSIDKEIHAFVAYRTYGVYFTIVGKSITREEGDHWPFYRLRNAEHNTQMIGWWGGRCWISKSGNINHEEGPIYTKKVVTRPFKSLASIKNYDINWYVKIPYSPQVRHLRIVST